MDRHGAFVHILRAPCPGSGRPPWWGSPTPAPVGPRWTCRRRSRRPAPASRPRRYRTRRCRPPDHNRPRPKKPRRTMNSLVRSRTSSSASVSGRSLRRDSYGRARGRRVGRCGGDAGQLELWERTQRTSCVGPTRDIEERDLSGAATVFGERAPRMEPAADGHARRRRDATGNGRQPLRAGRSLRLRADRARRGRGDGVGRTDRVVTPCSTICPAYMTATRSAILATTPRSWEMRSTLSPSSSWRDWSRVEDLGLHGDVESGGRLVGYEELGIAAQGDGHHHPLGHPAGELMRVVGQPLLRPRRCPPDRAGRFPRCGHRARERRRWARMASISWLPMLNTGSRLFCGS